MVVCFPRESTDSIEDVYCFRLRFVSTYVAISGLFTQPSLFRHGQELLSLGTRDTYLSNYRTLTSAVLYDTRPSDLSLQACPKELLIIIITSFSDPILRPPTCILITVLRTDWLRNHNRLARRFSRVSLAKPAMQNRFIHNFISN